MLNEKLFNLAKEIIEKQSAKAGKYNQLRRAEMERLLNPKNDGCLGDIFELYLQADNSPIVNVRRQGETDKYIYENGKRYNVEIKTNGGRINLNDIEKNDYIIYILCAHNSTVNDEIDYPIIAKVSDFMANVKLKKQQHNSECDGVAIQVSNKAFRAWAHKQKQYKI